MTADLGRSVDQTDIKFLIEKSADGVIVVDDTGVVVFANPAAETLFGRTADALIGTRIGIPLVAGDTTEISIRRPAGDQVDTEIRCVDTTWNRERARLASLRDISARKAVEEQLRHSIKMEAVGRLTAGIAHDFNNLLTVVLGNLDGAQRLLAADSPARSAIDNAIQGARRAAVLTERLLAFARRTPLEPSVLDVNVLVAAMTDLLRRTLGERINIRTVLGDNLWNIAVDPSELEAAILNLAVNARDAMPDGGELCIETANVELDATYAATKRDVVPGSYVLISVADNGCGMTDDVRKLVFEPFFTTKTRGSGTGLGLSQVYGFVKQSGGHVYLYSEPGIGTTAKLYLPRVEQGVASFLPMAATESTAGRVPRARPGETVLVVEDDEDVRKYTVGSLRELGYNVHEAGDASAALTILEREPAIKLLLTDLGLPGGMDGKALAERARERCPTLIVAMTTAYAGSALIHEGRLDEDVELLSKPFTFMALARCIRELLDGGRGHDPKCTSILVVDDEPLVRTFVVDALADTDVTTAEAGSFADAMTKFRADGDEIAAVIVDLGLPDRSGAELVAQIRASRPHTPIVLATGFADFDVHQRLSQDAHLRILEKPFTRASLVAALESLGVAVRVISAQP